MQFMASYMRFSDSFTASSTVHVSACMCVYVCPCTCTMHGDLCIASHESHATTHLPCNSRARTQGGERVGAGGERVGSLLQPVDSASEPRLGTAALQVGQRHASSPLRGRAAAQSGKRAALHEPHDQIGRLHQAKARLLSGRLLLICVWHRLASAGPGKRRRRGKTRGVGAGAAHRAGRCRGRQGGTHSACERQHLAYVVTVTQASRTLLARL